MSNPSLRPPGESPPVPSPPRISSVTQGSTDHWRVLVLFRVFRREPVAQVVNTIFSRFTDAQISAVLLPLLKSRPEALRQRVLIAALSLAHSELGESINSRSSSAGSRAGSPSSPSSSSSASRDGVALPRTLLHPLTDRELRGSAGAPVETSVKKNVNSTIRLLGRDSVGFTTTEQDEHPVIAQQFRLVTDGGEQFTVNVAPNSTPSCDCPAFVAAPDYCCEHLLFVYVQVLKLPAARQAVAEALKKPGVFEDIERDQNVSRLHPCPICFKLEGRGPFSMTCGGCGGKIYHKRCHDVWIAHYRQLAESSGTTGQFATLPGTTPALCVRCAPPIVRLVETNGTVLKIVTASITPP